MSGKLPEGVVLEVRDDVDMVEHLERLKNKETITINGKKYAMPLKIEPELVGTRYYFVNFDWERGYYAQSRCWNNRKEEFIALENKTLFATEQECKDVADAFNAALRGDCNE